MPKWKGEWDSIDDPNMHELQEGSDLENDIQHQIYDLDEIMRGWDEYGWSIPHPSDILHRTDEIREDMKELPAHEKEALEKQLKRIEEKRFSLYGPHYEKLVEKTGYSLSRGERPFQSPEDVIREMEAEIKSLQSEGGDQTEVVEEMENAIRLLDMYKHEPLFFTVRHEANKLAQELPGHPDEWLVMRGKDPRKGIDHAPSREREQVVINELTDRLDKLVELSLSLRDEGVKYEALRLMENLQIGLDTLTFLHEAPQEIILFDLRIRELAEQAVQEGEVNQAKLNELSEQMSVFEQRMREAGWHGWDLREVFDELRMQVVKIRTTNPSDFWEQLKGSRFDQSQQRAALAAMGFDSMPDPKTLKARYKELALKYHPDHPNGNEKNMQAINQAYDILKQS